MSRRQVQANFRYFFKDSRFISKSDVYVATFRQWEFTKIDLFPLYGVSWFPRIKIDKDGNE